MIESTAILISKLDDPCLIKEMQAIVNFHFSRDVRHYLEMDLASYHSLVAGAQDEFNRRNLARRLAQDRRHQLSVILGSDRIMLQTNLYLRATRPKQVMHQENIGWHRESFYGPSMQTAVNFWLPVANVNMDNTLRFISESHLIPDEAIETVNEDDPVVARGSAGHKIGLLYSPKRIVSGVDLSCPRPFIVLPGEAAIFSGQLIHGAAENHSEQIRFSIDFRLIAAANLTDRKQHFASGKEYFEEL